MSYPIDVGRFQVYDDNTFSQTFGFERNAQPYDLTAWTGWRAEWRGDDEGELVTLAVDTSSLADGIVSVSAPAALVPLMHSPGAFDLKAARGSEVRTWIRASTYWRAGVTRDTEGAPEL